MRAVTCLVFSAAIGSTASAQPLPSAAPAGSASAPAALTAPGVLANVQQYYASAKQLTASFRQVVTNATFNTKKTSVGSLWVAKPSNFRWDYVQKNHGVAKVVRSFVSDGQTFWLVDHANKQIMQSQLQNSTMPAAVSFLTGAANLSSQFNVTLNTTGTYGGTSDVVLELTPKQSSAQYSKLYFVIDPSNWRVKESIVIDSSGDTNTFQFYAPDLTKPTKPQWFQVSPSSLPSYNVVVSGAGSAAPTTGSAGAAVPAQGPHK